jgi:hypothetical protein
VFVHSTGVVVPLLVVEYPPRPVSINASTRIVTSPWLQRLIDRSWSLCDDLFATGQFSSDALVSVRAAVVGALTVEDDQDVLYTGPISVVPPLWTTACRQSGSVAVLAGIAVGICRPGWESHLPELAAKGLLLGALGTVTLPTNWPASRVDT